MTASHAASTSTAISAPPDGPAGPPPLRPASGWRHASPAAAYRLAGQLIPWLGSTGALLLAAGLALGLFVAPTDAQQGEVYRLLFVHVPTAWLSMVVYLAMALWAALGWVLGTRASFMMVQALAPTGALLCALCLATGALWGQPTWGTWWVWDARLTSVLLLLFLYLGFIALHAATPEPGRADRAGALLVGVGVVNLPVIHFSVTWWNTLHQGASVSIAAAPTLATPMLAGLLICTAGLWLWTAAVVLSRFRLIVLTRERHSAWVRQLPELRGASRITPGDVQLWRQAVQAVQGVQGAHGTPATPTPSIPPQGEQA